MKKTLAVLEGDGIGPEIMREGIKALRTIEKKFDHEFVLEYAPFGASSYFEEGSPFPDKTKALCDRADAIIKGPVGLSIEETKKIPQESRPELGAILPLRKRFNTYANYRPVRLPKSLASFSPLRDSVVGEGIDILMIRELVGGIYFGEKEEGTATGMKYARDDCIYTAEQVRAIGKIAFDEARRLGTKMTHVHKSNVLATSRLWDAIIEDMAREYDDVECVSIIVDNAAFQLVKNPTQFNGVMLLENMQGDILTDQAGGLLGSLGLMPSACMGPEKGYVEPAHGSAPDIAGQNIANPYSMIGSIAFLLDKCLGLKEESDALWNAMFDILERGYATSELASETTDPKNVLSTSDFGDMVVDILSH